MTRRLRGGMRPYGPWLVLPMPLFAAVPWHLLGELESEEEGDEVEEGGSGFPPARE